MKIRAERNEFVEAISWATRPLPSRPALPALAGLLLDADDDRLVVRATDLELSAEVSVAVQVDEPGIALLPGRLVAQIAARLPDAPVEIHGPSDRVGITCGRARFNVRGMPVADFPTIPVPTEDAPRGRIDAHAFVRMVSQVTRAASTDEARPVLTGVQLEADASGLVAAATDSYRLAMRRVTWADGPEVHALVPSRALSEAAKSVPEVGGQVEIVFEEGQVSMLFGDRRLQTSLVEGAFPDYRQLLPDAFETLVVAGRQDLMEALQRVSVVTLGQANTPVILKFSEGTVELSADTQELGEASEEIPIELEGDGLEIAFNPMFLLSGLDGVITDEVQIELRDGLKPAVLKAHPDDEDEGIYLLMPVRQN